MTTRKMLANSTNFITETSYIDWADVADFQKVIEV